MKKTGDCEGDPPFSIIHRRRKMKIELLAPAGSYETILAAFQAGADAVYTGGGRFGARAYARNLAEEELLSAIDYAHLHGKKLYLTVNTLIKEEEMKEELYQYLLPYYRQGLDAVIVQDLGVMSWLREVFPDLSLHVSTQAAVTGPKGAHLLEKLGASRVVPARELSLEEIRRIREETDLEIETFVHGALCYSYSGQCLFSSILGGRSGNRGRCAQPCRLPYQLYQNGRRLSAPGQEYLLSPKDICTVDLLPEILAAGVTSLKIEGRMKRAEYTAGVVRIYRKYLDRCLQGRPEKLSKEDRAQLMLLFNRDGFSGGYYRVRNGREMIALSNTKEKERESKEVSVKREALYQEIRKSWMEEKEKEKIKGNLKLFPGAPAILELNCGQAAVAVLGDEVQYARNHPLPGERILQQMKKTGASPFCFEELTLEMEDPVFLPVQSLNRLRREGLEAMEQELLGVWRRKEAKELKKSGEDKTEQAEETKRKKAFFWSALAETAEQLEVLLEEPSLSRIYSGWGCFDRECLAEEAEKYRKIAEEKKKAFYPALPHVVRSGDLKRLEQEIRIFERAGVSGFLVRNLESLGLLEEMGLGSKAVLDSSVYTFNSAAQELVKKFGVAGDTVPAELNFREMRRRENRDSELVVYGRLPLMISAQCLAKTTRGCDKKSGIYQLRDRKGTEFCVKCQCGFCYNIIYNSVPVSLFPELEAAERLGAGGWRLSFTLEGKEETRRVLREFLGAGSGADKKQEETPYTKGHFRRGVE